MNNDDEQQDKPKHSMINMAVSIANFIKKVPAWAWPILGYVAIGIGVIILIIFVIMTPSAVAEDIKNTISEWGDNIGNLLSINGSNPEEEAEKTKKMEIKFYEELDKQRKYFKDYYGVNINTTLITATLFYNREFGSYTSDNGCSSEEYEAGTCDSSCSKEDAEAGICVTDLVVSDADFYKKAKGHIKTLAKYMTINVIENNSCVKQNPSRTTSPKTPKEIANASTKWSVGNAFSSEKTITNKVLYNGNVLDCPYSDVTGYYLSEYQKDKNIIVSAANRVNQDCEFVTGNPAEQQRCKIAEGNYNDKLGLYDKWGGTITDSDPGSSSSSVNFKCPYVKQKPDPAHGIITVGYENNGCSELPKTVTRHMIDDSRGGVYYYKLMTKFTTFGFEDNDSFISKYYASYVKADDEETMSENVVKTVDGIYDLYETIRKGTDPSYIEGGVGSPSVSGDYASWSQKDPRWGNVPIGSNNIYNIGCAATSVAILLARSGALVNINGELNPGTFVEAMTANGGFSGNNINWGAVNNFAPTFFFIDSGNNLTVDRLTELLTQGYYVTVKVLTGDDQHWVAIDRVENGTVYMNDPAFMKNEKHPPSEDLFAGGWGIPYGMHAYRVYENRV